MVILDEFLRGPESDPKKAAELLGREDSHLLAAQGVRNFKDVEWFHFSLYIALKVKPKCCTLSGVIAQVEDGGRSSSSLVNLAAGADS